MNARKTLWLFTVAFILLLAVAAPALAVQSKNVAVSKVTSTAAVLVVKADVTADVEVDYGTAPGVYSYTRTSNGLIRHEIVLDSLTPAATIYYRVIITDSANPAASITLPEKSFHTARAAGQPFSFAAAGDNRPPTNSDVTQPAVWNTIVAQMSSENLDLSLNVGDIIYGWGTDTPVQNEAKYDGLFASTAPLTATVPLYVAVGNHEWISTAVNKTGYERELALPVNNGADAATNGEEYYSFDSGDTHFIALCTEIPGQEGTVVGNQKAWLQQDLAANTKRWIVVFFHRPMFAGTHTSDPWTDVTNVAGQQNKADMQALFTQYHVNLVFEGHEHFYQHHVEGSVNYVITGGGGAPLYPAPALGAGDIFTASTFEHVKVDETSTSLNVTAIDSTGVTIESFTLTGPNLHLAQNRIYWSSYADYVNHDLSVEYSIANSGGDATNLRVAYLGASNGVLPLTFTPVVLGGLAGGASTPVTIHYLVPTGVAAFRATTYVTCNDPSGGTYSYPGPPPL
ncbi:MAG: metallophosphoesterase [Thermoleophilia bacterium]